MYDDQQQRPLDVVITGLNVEPLVTQQVNIACYDWADLRGINQPVGGWRQNTMYLVEVKFSANNLPHRTWFWSGLLTERGTPGGYNRFVETDGPLSLYDAYWLQVIAALPDVGSSFWEGNTKRVS